MAALPMERKEAGEEERKAEAKAKEEGEKKEIVTESGQGRKEEEGTSMAAAHVAALMAGYLCDMPATTTPKELKQEVIERATKGKVKDIPADTPALLICQWEKEEMVTDKEQQRVEEEAIKFLKTLPKKSEPIPLEYEESPDRILGQYIVVFEKNATDEEVTSHIEAIKKVTSVKKYDFGDSCGYAASMDDEMLDVVRLVSHVSSVECNEIVHLACVEVQDDAPWVSDVKEQKNATSEEVTSHIEAIKKVTSVQEYDFGDGYGYAANMNNELRDVVRCVSHVSCVECDEMGHLTCVEKQDNAPWGTCNGNSGYFPASYVQTVSLGNHIMQALYDFAPQGPGELVLEEGQILVMLRDNQDGWMFGRSGTEEGLFPQNYVKELTTV